MAVRQSVQNGRPGMAGYGGSGIYKKSDNNGSNFGKGLASLSCAPWDGPGVRSAVGRWKRLFR